MYAALGRLAVRPDTSNVTNIDIKVTALDIKRVRFSAINYLGTLINSNAKIINTYTLVSGDK